MSSVSVSTVPSSQAFQAMKVEILRLEHLLKLKDEEIRLLNIRLFGPKSEKISSDQIQLLLDEVVVTPEEIETVAKDHQPKTRKPRPNHPGRTELPEHLERREEIIPCDPKDCCCSKCGEERPVIGYDPREELVVEPARFWVRVVKREKRGSHCLEEQGVVTAPAPGQIVPKGKLSTEFIVEVMARKFKQHDPIFRQLAALEEDHGIQIDRKTVNSSILAAGELLIPVIGAQAMELKAGGYLQADETPVPCQTREKTGKNHRSYIWEYSLPGGPVVFDFQMGRSRAGPEKFLKGFEGKVQCDGYSAYGGLGEKITWVGCMAHARRGFADALKLGPKDRVPIEVIGRIQELYVIEEEARQSGMSPEARQELRQKKSVPVMEGLKRRVTEIRQEIPPGSKLAQACGYMLGNGV